MKSPTDKGFNRSRGVAPRIERSFKDGPQKAPQNWKAVSKRQIWPTYRMFLQLCWAHSSHLQHTQRIGPRHRLCALLAPQFVRNESSGLILPNYFPLQWQSDGTI